MQRAFPRGWRKDFSSLHKLMVTCVCKESRAWSLLWSDPARMEKGSLSEMLRYLACFCAGLWASVSPLCFLGACCSSCRCVGGSFTVCLLCSLCVVPELLLLH